SNVWVVGNYCTSNCNNYDQLTLIEHWDGTSWSLVPSPNPGAGYISLYAVAAVSANDVWAVGNYYNGNLTPTLIEHWDGASWSVVESVDVAYEANFLYGVTAVSANDVWAMGYSRYPYSTFMERWNGTGWYVVAIPGPGIYSLGGIAGVSANDMWAVGSYNSG